MPPLPSGLPPAREVPGQSRPGVTVAAADASPPWGLGNISLEKSKRKKPCAWLPDQGWEDIMLLSELFSEDFGSLPDDVEKHPTVWQEVSPHSLPRHPVPPHQPPAYPAALPCGDRHAPGGLIQI